MTGTAPGGGTVNFSDKSRAGLQFCPPGPTRRYAACLWFYL